MNIDEMHASNARAWDEAAAYYETEIQADIEFLRAGGKIFALLSWRTLVSSRGGVAAPFTCSVLAAATHFRCGIWGHSPLLAWTSMRACLPVPRPKRRHSVPRRNGIAVTYCIPRLNLMPRRTLCTPVAAHCVG